MSKSIKYLCLLLIGVTIFTGCAQRQKAGLEDVYYAEYEYKNDVVSMSPELTYLELFGISMDDVYAERARVESGGGEFSITCKVEWSTYIFETVRVELTIENIKNKVVTVEDGDAEALRTGIKSLLDVRKNSSEGVPYGAGYALLQYGNKRVEAVILLYCDDAVINNFDEEYGVEARVIGLIPKYIN